MEPLDSMKFVLMLSDHLSRGYSHFLPSSLDSGNTSRTGKECSLTSIGIALVRSTVVSSKPPSNSLDTIYPLNSSTSLRRNTVMSFFSSVKSTVAHLCLPPGKTCLKPLQLWPLLLFLDLAVDNRRQVKQSESPLIDSSELAL